MPFSDIERLPEGKSVAIIGGGPAGLIAAEMLACAGATVAVYDQMPSLGRKFLLAGRGGLNLTYSEDLATFLTRYGDINPLLRGDRGVSPRRRCGHGATVSARKPSSAPAGGCFPRR